MRTSDFDYQLPPQLIAQHPVEPRHSSRLLVLNRGDGGGIEHRRFTDLPSFLKRGDVLVFNESRVIPARLEGVLADRGRKIEVLLLGRLEAGLWQALAKPARKAVAGAEIDFSGLKATVFEKGSEGVIRLRFADEGRLESLGSIPLPPYIKMPLSDPERYQTVYARNPGSAAAPTAGLHFTEDIFRELDALGVVRLFVNLHIGLDTFRPVREEDPLKHHIHREFGFMDEKTAVAISKAKEEGRRVIGVGTSAVRLLESVAEMNDGLVKPYEGWVGLFILSGHRFRVVDAMVTNFHLPRSTLLMLVSAFAGRELIKRAYDEAIAQRYRFYSFGDAMLII